MYQWCHVVCCMLCYSISLCLQQQINNNNMYNMHMYGVGGCVFLFVSVP